MSKPILGLSWLGPPSARLAKFNRQRGDWLGRILKQKFAGPKILPGNKRRKQQHSLVRIEIPKKKTRPRTSTAHNPLPHGRKPKVKKSDTYKHAHIAPPLSTRRYRTETKHPKTQKTPRYRTTRALHTGDRHTVPPPNNNTRTPSYPAEGGDSACPLPPPFSTKTAHPASNQRHQRATSETHRCSRAFCLPSAHNVCVCV
ncbi:unnamed protein product [Ectocarpus sp. 12 AP-2014]